MAVLRVFLIVVAIVWFFAVATPAQWILGRLGFSIGNNIPILFCRSLLRLLRVTVEVTGAPSPARPLLVIVNHISWIDILVLGSRTSFCFLAKSEVGSWPLIAAIAKVQGTVFIDRRRRREIPLANGRMADRMADGRIMLLFPEGTTLGDALPGRFYTSHFAAARDLLRANPAEGAVFVQPIALAYSSPLAAWIGEEALLPHLWRVLRGAPLHCHVVFCAPIPYTRDHDRKIVARLSRDAVVAALAHSPWWHATHRSDAEPAEHPPFR